MRRCSLLGCFLIAAFVSSCSDRPTTAKAVKNPLLSINEPAGYEGCWPPGPDCVERELTSTEQQRVNTAISWISLETATCSSVWNHANEQTIGSRIRYWAEGSKVEDYDGDVHRDTLVRITHLTPSAFDDDWKLARVIVHETAHFLGYSDGEANDLEMECLPDPM